MDQKLNNLEIKDEDSHGALVRDIIESKKNIENDKGKRRTVLSEAEEQKARKQTEQLQGDIQQISRTTAPIGRILGFISCLWRFFQIFFQTLFKKIWTPCKLNMKFGMMN